MKILLRAFVRFSLMIFVIGSTYGLTGCNDNSDRLSTLRISPTASTLTLGTTQQLKVNAIYSSDTVTDVTSSSTFSSLNSAVASVSSSGLVTGVSAGTAVITATALGQSTETLITVAVSGVTVLHASPDAPNVNVVVDGATAIKNLEFGQGTGVVTLATGAHTFAVQAQLPGNALATVIPASGSLSETLAAGTQYVIVAEGDVANLSGQIFSRSLTTVAAGQVRVEVLHAAPAAPPVDVYVTTPGAGVASTTPIGTFAFKGSLGPLEVPAGSYEIYVTLKGTKTVVFDSGTVPLTSGADLLLTAEQNTGPGSSPITLAVTDAAGNNSELLDVSTPAELRVVHASPDAPAVSVYTNDSLATPLVGCLAFPGYTGPEAASCPSFTPYVSIFPAKSVESVQVTPYGNPGVLAINAPVTLATGIKYSVYAVGKLASIAPLITSDDDRRVATEAKLRLIHASPSAGNVDIYLTPTSSIAGIAPVAANVPFKADTGFLAVAPGAYYLTITQTGSSTAAIGPLAVTLNAAGIYTGAAVDHVGGGGPFGVILLDDFVP